MRAEAYVTTETIERESACWLERLRESVPRRPRLKLEPERAALLVIDMVRYFADADGRGYLPASRAIVPKIAAMLSVWRERRGVVVFTRHGHLGDGDLGTLGKFFSDFIREGQPESRIIDALRPRDDELVLRKTTYDAFLNTHLQKELEQRGIEQVVVTGVLTHMCCETTARSAFCRGFEVYLPVDATASNSLERHLAALGGLSAAVAVPLRTTEVLASCAKRES